MIVTVDLVTRTLALPDSWAASFAISDVPRDRLLRGLDMIGKTMDEEADIAAFEKAHSQQLAWSRRASI